MDRERGRRNAGPDGRDAFASERHALEISHHFDAILMSDEASLQDQRIRELYKTIDAQQQEIDQMRGIWRT